MAWVLLLVVGALVVMVAMNGRGQVPWGKKMRRVPTDVAHKAEWMAPEAVVARVREDYALVTRWMQEHMLSPWQHQVQAASTFMSGAFLLRYQTILRQQGRSNRPRAVGILRSDHHVTVRHFSEDGEACYVIDHQMQRRMATYDARTHERIMTQDLGDGTVVYKMRYDAVDQRWKIDEFVQELPPGWGKHRAEPRIRELSALPTTIGRDH